MKELIYFATGLLIGAWMMKNSYATDELKKELIRERTRNSSANTAKAA
ncbi:MULTISPECIES: hypothetical protein [Brenneria]|nr:MULTISPECIES: hypothetical protein [unclassified Brenneria]MDX5630671.1 hypothetical protein [Brenneria sp. L3-3Z]MDX5697766.1 hypothetical protein [Brenneria sp. L4-2C]MEE3664493.1 hypothetical protein [Brenneria sp. g21c3]